MMPILLGAPIELPRALKKKKKKLSFLDKIIQRMRKGGLSTGGRAVATH
jgi:hypothetical protein